jgi:hypothetical protein
LSSGFERVYEILENSSLEPSLIWIDDSTESNYTCQQIARLIDTQFLNIGTNQIVIMNLKSSQMIQPFEVHPTVMFGVRFSLNIEAITKLVIKLKQIGIQVFQDNREYGGGPLVSTLIQILKLPKDSVVVELTFSQSALEEISCVEAIADFFASEWM